MNKVDVWNERNKVIEWLLNSNLIPETELKFKLAGYRTAV